MKKKNANESNCFALVVLLLHASRTKQNPAESSRRAVQYVYLGFYQKKVHYSNTFGGSFGQSQGSWHAFYLAAERSVPYFGHKQNRYTFFGLCPILK